MNFQSYQDISNTPKEVPQFEKFADLAQMKKANKKQWKGIINIEDYGNFRLKLIYNWLYR